MRQVVVIGGGITGLAAAYELTRDEAVDVTVFEATDRIGGKLHTSTFAGRLLDEGADAFLVRVPWAVDLCRELDLETELVAPATGHAYVWSRGALRPIPDATVLGVPTDFGALAASGVVSDEACRRAAEDLTRPDDGPNGDESVGALVRRRLGDEVFERLVAPLVGGINAGDADRLSVRAVTPQLAAARGSGPSLVVALREQRAAAVGSGAPVFLSPRDGMGVLADRLAAMVAERASIVTRTPIQSLSADERLAAADGVVVATPAPVAAQLLAKVAPDAAQALGEIEHASVAIVALALPRAAIDRPLDGSGFLVPSVEGLFVTACSWATSKWAHLDTANDVLLRVSVGRAGAAGAQVDALDDRELVARVLDDLRTTMAVVSAPAEARVTRWPSSFPQYAPGHLDRVAAIDADLAAAAPTVVATGAWARGVGVPACIREGREAARRVVAALRN